MNPQLLLAYVGGHFISALPTAGSPSPSPREFKDDDLQPGPVPLAVVIILLLASWLLVRSMRTHLKRIPADLDVHLRTTESEKLPDSPRIPAEDSRS